ncbi:hypothetical protein [Anoxybacillus flavithermus]|nr:hypothetical protein [Anoxybacillus flavithermus]
MDAVNEIKKFVTSLRSLVGDLCSLVDSKQTNKSEYTEGVTDGHKIAMVILDILEKKIDSVGGKTK